MAKLLKYAVLSIIFILDTVDKILRFFGLKLYKLTTERVLGSLGPEQLEETKEKDVALPFRLFIKVMKISTV